MQDAAASPDAEDGEIDASLCDVCHVHPHKYRCAVCGASRTCSVACNRSHKEAGCETTRASRSTSRFIPLDAFTDAQTFEDYTFLERTKRKTEELQGSLPTSNKIPKHRALLQKALKNRGTKVRWMPEGMQRRTANGSRLRDGKTIWWSVEVLAEFVPDVYSDEQQQSHLPAAQFTNNESEDSCFGEDAAAVCTKSSNKLNLDAIDAQFVRQKMVIDNVCETLSIEEIWKRCIGKLRLPAETPLLSAHVASAAGDLQQDAWLLVDAQCSLREALDGASLVEFPTLRLTFGALSQ